MGHIFIILGFPIQEHIVSLYFFQESSKHSGYWFSGVWSHTAWMSPKPILPHASQLSNSDKAIYLSITLRHNNVLQDHFEDERS